MVSIAIFRNFFLDLVRVNYSKIQGNLKLIQFIKVGLKTKLIKGNYFK